MGSCMNLSDVLPSLSSIERQDRILQIVEQARRITIPEICDQFSISEATARRDLDVLAEQGKIRRVHGGAIPLQKAPPELPILQRNAEQLDEKRRIGLTASQLISEHETVFLGSGTTVLEVTRYLRSRSQLTVITNSLPVINLLADAPGISLVSLGGFFRQSELSFIGHITEQSLSEVRADKAVLGIRALSLEEGLTNDYLPETMTDRAILNVGKEVIIVADHTKLGVISTAIVAPLSRIHTVVTDQQAPLEFVRALKDRGLRVILS